MSFKKYLIRFSALTTLCISTALAGPQHEHRSYGILTTIDFSASSGLTGHHNWDTWTTPNGFAGTKYMWLDMGPRFSGAGNCYYIHIIDNGVTETVDLRFWTNANVSIDDDGAAGDRKPRAKFWITSPYSIKISAYSYSYNNVDFLISTQIDSYVTTAASCDDGVLPFYNQATNTLVRANTTAN